MVAGAHSLSACQLEIADIAVDCGSESPCIAIVHERAVDARDDRFTNSPLGDSDNCCAREIRFER